MRALGLAVAVAVLGILPGAAAALFETQLPPQTSFREGLLLVGHVRLPETDLPDPFVQDLAAVEWTQGTLTVCPREGRGTILEALARVRPTCEGAQEFGEASLRAMPGTDMQFLGEYAVQRPAGASMAMPAGGGEGQVAWAMLLSPDPMLWAGPEGRFRFASNDSAASVQVVQGDEGQWFNGTDWLFLLDAPEAAVAGAGLAAWLPEPVQVALSPTEVQHVRRLPDPFRLLGLQAYLLGPEEREPRTNATALLRTYGRVPAYVNGALVGHWNGTLGGETMGHGVTLVRVASLEGTIEEGRFWGEADPEARVQGAAASVQGSGLTGPPWLLAGVMWSVALIVLVVRRHPVPVVGARRVVRLGAWVLGFVAVDLVVLRRGLGTSMISSWGEEPVGTAIALGAFTLAATAWTWFLLHQPLRLIAAKVLPARRRWAGDAGAAVAWLLLVMLWPAMVIASGLNWARL